MPSTDLVVRERSEHGISRKDIDPDALKVLYRLVRKGHTAYLVGGGVRDLLLGRAPKDFDVSTDARPEEIRRIFRNAFLIGRRFRLAHIRFGKKVIETSTFRSAPDPDEDAEDPEADLLQRDDNTFGSPEEDARRRDFTINGLFYDIQTFRVLDYVGGLKDLKDRRIRTIGDPDIRFREDPVRMVRAARFAARLDFRIERKTLDALKRHHREIEKASPARLLEEVYRLFGYRSGEAAFRLLYSTRLLEALFPVIHAYLKKRKRNEQEAYWSYLAALDRGDTMIPEPTPAMLFATLYYPIVLSEARHEVLEEAPKDAETATDLVTEPMRERISVPRRVRDRMRRILAMQRRFEPSGQSRRFSRTRFVRQDLFLEALALYEIHLQACGRDLAEAQSWRDLYMEKTEGEGADEQNDADDNGRSRRSRRSRGRRKRSGGEGKEAKREPRPPAGERTADAEAAEETDATSSGSDDAPAEGEGKKKSRRSRRGGRRRRKKSSAKTEDGAQPAASGAEDDAPSPADTKGGKRKGTEAKTEEEGDASESGGSSRRSSRRRRRSRKKSGSGSGEEGGASGGDAPGPSSSRRPKGPVLDIDAPLTPTAGYQAVKRPGGEREEKPSGGKEARSTPSSSSSTPPPEERSPRPRPGKGEAPAPSTPHWLDEV